jgi:hypothetical protein
MYSHGLWDIFLGCWFLLFVIGPYLSPSLGDFWSAAVFVPFLLGVLLVIYLVMKFVVTPRMGSAKFGPTRKTKLAMFTAVMLVINIVAFILGLVAALKFSWVSGRMISIMFGLILLVCFSTAAYFLDFGRLYVYGLLLGFSPLVGEWLWTCGYATHHGFPVTFGISAGTMVLVGLVLFVRFLRTSAVLSKSLPPGEV